MSSVLSTCLVGKCLVGTCLGRGRRDRQMSMLTVVDVLVGSAEITELLGLSRARTFQITSSPDSPAPVQELKMGKVWRLTDVRACARRTGRTLHERH